MQRVPMRIVILDVVLTRYRLPLFDRLSSIPEFDLTVFYSPTFPERGLTSCKEEGRCRYRSVPCKTYFGGRLYWQECMNVLDELQRCDVLVLVGEPRNLSVLSLLIKARRRGIGTLWWGHGFSPGSSRVTTYIRRQIMRYPDALLLYTDREVERFRELGYPEERLFAANNTISINDVFLAKETWTPERLNAFQSEHKLVPGKLLVFCSRLLRERRVDWLLEAFGLLSRDNPQYQLAIIGSGDAQSELAELERKKKIAGVRWLGEKYDQNEIAPWFLSASIAVHPRWLGLSVFHYFGYGLPVITSENPRHQGPEIAAVKSLETGVFFRDGDVQDLAMQIRFVTKHEELRAKMSANALKTVQTDFSFDNMVSRVTHAIIATRELAQSARG
jgi:glycosyltransferase involved in cell wall biosynthesis